MVQIMFFSTPSLQKSYAKFVSDELLLIKLSASIFTKQGVRKAAETSPKDGIDISMPRKALERLGPKVPDKR